MLTKSARKSKQKHAQFGPVKSYKGWKRFGTARPGDAVLFHYVNGIL